MTVSNFIRPGKVLAACALAATLLLSAGCAVTPRLEQRFKARMRVQNPHDRSIAVRGVSYTLQIGGEELGRGLSGSSFTVPASGEAEFDMLVTANLAGTVMRLLERARSDGLPDSLSYRLRGEVKLAEGLVRTIPFDEKGSVRLR
jgi:LEA14-like dessication related protein